LVADLFCAYIALFKRSVTTPEVTMVRVVPIEVTIWVVVPIVMVRMIVAIVTIVVRIVAIPSCGWSHAADSDCADNT
jgi:hypothetical protein